MRPRTIVIIGAGTALAAWLAVSAVHAPNQEVALPELPPTLPPQSEPEPRSSELMRAQLENFRLRKRLAAVEGELKHATRVAPAVTEPAAVADGGGGASSPLPFPADLPEPYTPEGFERVALEAAETCGLGLDVVAIDCSEYPCIAWTEAIDSEVKQFSMSKCTPWRSAFSNGEVVIGATGINDGGAGPRYFAWMAVPADRADLPVAARRARERVRSMSEALGATGP